MHNNLENTSIWQVSREYAGIAEAGGVKNVVRSLSEGLEKNKCNVTLFIPLYGCSMLSTISDFDIIPGSTISIKILDHFFKVSFGKAMNNGVRIIFIISTLFTEKMGIYTYTALEETLDSFHHRGCGHEDSQILEILFQRAVLEFARNFNEIPDIVHCHDATTALLPAFAKEFPEYSNNFKNTSFLVTIHNAGPGYHHEFVSLEEATKLTGLSEQVLKKGLSGSCVEPYLIAGQYAHLNTVSPWYADEILKIDNMNTAGLSREFSIRKMEITGITNGIDYEKYNPTDTKKSCLPEAYNPEILDLSGKRKAKKLFLDTFSTKKTTDQVTNLVSIARGIEQFGYIDSKNSQCIYFSYHGRLVHQKGLDVLAKTVPVILSKLPEARFIIIGQGTPELENEQINLSINYPGKLMYLRGYERSFVRLCVSISDFLLLPSLFEPCGLEDFIGQIFGTIPIAHATGGLQKIIDGETGFLYSENIPEKIAEIVVAIGKKFMHNPDSFLPIIQKAANNVHMNYSWSNVITKEYIPLYKKIKKN